MTYKDNSKTKIYDCLTFGFVILFAATLTNSIFLCQIGYFGALFTMAARWIFAKENNFEKTGLEIPFILFLSAELISAILSVDKPHAFVIFFKRLVLIPIVYVMVASSKDTKRAKIYFKVYIGAAIVTLAAYIVFAYEHFISQLYQLESRGPSPFQYVMTAGGLMSFSVIFLFAFLINEKTKLRLRFLILVAFLLASIALFASYTRAAWIGAAGGILFILIMKRQWLLLSAGLIVLLAGIFLSKNASNIYEYKIDGNKLEQINKFATAGRANNLFVSADTLIVADYENGISIRVGGKEILDIKTIAPVTGFKKWTDDYYIGFLVDSRVLLLKKKSFKELKIQNEFISPGHTVDYKIANGKFYVDDVDSGLTIFNDPNNLKNVTTISAFKGINNFDVDSSFFAGFNPLKSTFYVYNVENGIPKKCIDSLSIKSGVGFVWTIDKNIYLQSEKEFTKFSIKDNSVSKTSSLPLTGIFKLFMDTNGLWAGSAAGKFYKITSDASGKMISENIGDLGFIPTDYLKVGNDLFATQIKRNRFASIIDPYHDTNLERIQQWKTGWKILMDHPLFGVGDIDLIKTYAEYKDYYLKENFGHLHNNYVQFLVILGFVGFAAVMFMLISIFKLHLKIFRAVKSVEFISSYSLGAFAVFVGFLVSGLAEWNFGDQEIITMVWFTLGLNIAFYKNYLKNNFESPGESIE